VAEGEIFGLLGPNGAGKSTLIRMMTTLIPITSGKAIVAGHDVAKDPDAVRRMIGVIPQALTSDQDLTVEENLSIYAKLYSVPRGARKEHRRSAGSRRPGQVARRADQDALRRHAAPA
jgi:ABC-2 type transport system ATP-binding protein